jgi:hypothetical protein
MDPVGFGLENYDAIGAYRTTDGQAPIDSAGTLPNGRAFQGALELERIVAADPSYAECVVKNLYVYALGREPELTAGHMDGPTLASLADGFQKGGFSLPDLALRIATSPTFTSRRGEDP